MYSVRTLLQGVLGHIVHARMDMQALQLAVLEDMESGYRPTYRGHEWDRAQFADLEAANQIIEMAFSVLKGVQFPEMRDSRWSDALEQLDRCKDQATYGGSSGTQLPPGG